MSTDETGEKDLLLEGESPGELTRMETPEDDPGVHVEKFPPMPDVAGYIDKTGPGCGVSVVYDKSHIGAPGIPRDTLEGRGIVEEVVDEEAKRGPEK